MRQVCVCVCVCCVTHSCQYGYPVLSFTQVHFCLPEPTLTTAQLNLQAERVKHKTTERPVATAKMAGKELLRVRVCVSVCVCVITLTSIILTLSEGDTRTGELAVTRCAEATLLAAPPDWALPCGIDTHKYTYTHCLVTALGFHSPLSHMCVSPSLCVCVCMCVCVLCVCALTESHSSRLCRCCCCSDILSICC